MNLTVIPHIALTQVNLYPLADCHIGSSDCDMELLQHDINVIRDDPFAKVVIIGDLLQCDFKTSKGDVYNQALTPKEQRKKAKEMLTPIKDKIIAITEGNHDGGRSQEDSTPIEDLAEFLGVPYCAGEMLLKLLIGTKKNKKPAVYTFYATHGWSSGKKVGSAANALDSMKEVVYADIYAMGHTHKQNTHKDIFYLPDLYNNNVQERIRYFINTGSYQKRGMYPKRYGMNGQVLGTPLIKLSGVDKKITVEM